MSKAIGVYLDGELEWHMPSCGGPDNITFCGLDGDDPTIGQTMGPSPKRGQKITCGMCYTLFKNFKELKIRESDFTKQDA